MFHNFRSSAVCAHIIVATTFMLFVAIPNDALSQTADMWTEQARLRGLFVPHEDNCDGGTEVFIAVGGTTNGLCMEKDERSTAIWTQAKEICALANKRLPEPMEFQYACKNPPAGLTNMTNSSEWVSNNAYSHTLYNGSIFTIIGASVLGNGSTLSKLLPL